MGVMRMYEKLRMRVDELFQNAPRTRRANELKEELMANLIDKYNDLIAAGKSEEEAINSAIAGIGDVDELLRGLREQDIFNYDQVQKDRKKYALVLSSAIVIYIMSIVVLILCDELFAAGDTIGVCLMFTLDAVATGLIVYNAVSRPKYKKEDNTMVEEFKEWKSDKTHKNNIVRSIKSVVWTLIVAVYLIISFAFGIWAFSWIIFIIGVAVDRIITLAFQLRE